VGRKLHRSGQQAKVHSGLAAIAGEDGRKLEALGNEEMPRDASQAISGTENMDAVPEVCS
jgi:hypothetical protein